MMRPCKITSLILLVLLFGAACDSGSATDSDPPEEFSLTLRPEGIAFQWQTPILRRTSNGACSSIFSAMHPLPENQYRILATPGDSLQLLLVEKDNGVVEVENALHCSGGCQVVRTTHGAMLFKYEKDQPWILTSVTNEGRVVATETLTAPFTVFADTSAPTSDGGLLLIFESLVVKVDANAKEQWRVHVPIERIFASAERRSGGYLVGGSVAGIDGTGKLVGLDRQGNIVWEDDYDSVIRHIQPFPDSSALIIEQGAHLIDDTGEVLWRIEEEWVEPDVRIVDVLYGRRTARGVEVVLHRRESNPGRNLITTVGIGDEGTLLERYDWPYSFSRREGTRRILCSIKDFDVDEEDEAAALLICDNYQWNSGYCSGQMWGEIVGFENTP